MHRRLTLLLAVALLVAFHTGCGDKGPTRYHVSGSVTFQGKPVPIGSIQFTPDATKGNRGPAAFAEIKDGRYDTRSDGLGTVGGPHVVTVDAFDGQEIDPSILPNGKPIAQGFRKSFGLPKATEATLDLELAP